MIAEVIASDSKGFIAEITHKTPPDFGAWVCVKTSESLTLYGVVVHIETTHDSGRQPVALGKSRLELETEMPHVLTLIRTLMHVKVAAYKDQNGKIHQLTAPKPAALHDLVEPIDEHFIHQLSAPYDFLRNLVHTPDIPIDDILVCIFRQISAAYFSDTERNKVLIGASRTLSRLFSDDHERLQSILRRIN
jgi:hypothetical protein